MSKHIPVLLNEVLNALNIKQDGIYVDATFGRGGHSRAILSKLSEKGKLYALDRDESAIQEASSIKDPRFTIIHSEFSKLKDVLSRYDLIGKVDGILMDIGVSSPQIDDPLRGFSFDKSGPLDMRMNQNNSITCEYIVNNYTQDNLTYIFKTYGEEKFSSKIAKAIVARREIEPFTNTLDLANFISANIPGYSKKHKATRCFQALRIEVNQELEELKEALKQSLDILKDDGIMCVISFHSLEDRIVKQFFKENSVIGDMPRGLPLTDEEIAQRFKDKIKLYKVSQAIKASNEEIENNIRSRSAVLRFASKIKRD